MNAKRKSGSEFTRFLESVHNEAQSEGPEAVAELEAYRRYYAAVRRNIRAKQAGATNRVART